MNSCWFEQRLHNIRNNGPSGVSGRVEKVYPLQQNWSHRLSWDDRQLNLRWVTELRQVCGQEASFHLKIINTKSQAIETKLCVCWGNPGDGANMSPQDTVVAAFRPNRHAWASTQIKCRARLQRGALLFYLKGGICYIGESLLMSLKYVNTMCACRYEHAHDWKNVHHTQTHTGTKIYSSNLHKAASHTVSRCLEIPCLVMTSGRLQYNTGNALWKIFEDADLTLLGKTNFMTCNNKEWAESDLTPQTTT